MTPIALFASGRGSNFTAVYDAIKNGTLKAEIVAVVSDCEDAPVLEKARSFGLKTVFVPVERDRPVIERRRMHEEKILTSLQLLRPHFIVLAGYMRVLSSFFIDAYASGKGYSRIVNIHPSLLPSFPGVKSYAQAHRYGVKWTGVTVHFVENAIDSGPICAQEGFSIADCKTVAEVESRGLAVEHRLYPETLKWILPENFKLVDRSGGRFCVCPN
jgi:phosphoribosylglycinamide formyltransferase-1